MATDYFSATKRATDLSPDMPPAQVKAEQAIRWVYHWLFWSVFITVPWMGLNLGILASLFYGAPTSGFVLAVLLPVLAHAVLFFGLGSPHLYARRHTQQAFILVGLRALSALFFMGLMQGSGVCLWIIVNGFFWLVGTVWGLRQVKRGDCWLMRWKGEDVKLPRPWAVPTSVAATPAASVPAAGVPVSPAPAAYSPFETPADPQAAFERGQSLVRQSQRAEAVACFMVAFRDGPPDLRRRAVAELEKLGEVETF